MRRFEREQFIDASENISILRSRDHYREPLHTHSFAELIFISAGTCRQEIDGVAYQAEAGDLLFVNYGQTHAFETEDQAFQYYNLLYLPQFFSEELINSENIYEIFRMSLFREFGDQPAEAIQRVRFRGEAYLEIQKLAEDMYREFRLKQVGYRSVLNGYSRVLFSKMLREMSRSGLAQPGDLASMQRITAECLAYINAHCFEKISPREIAEHTFYHPAYLSRIFKASCGMSLSDYIKEKRIREAARLLRETDWPLEKVMAQVGYSDKKQFYAYFKAFYQETPAQYRKGLDSQNTPPGG